MRPAQQWAYGARRDIPMKTVKAVATMDRAWRFREGEYRQPVVVETETEPVWLHFYIQEGRYWFVSVALYPNALESGDYSWTIGAFDPGLGRFLREDEYEQTGPDQYCENPPRCVPRKRVRVIEKGVGFYLKEHPAKVEELISREQLLGLERHRQSLKQFRERQREAAYQPSAAVA
jgi:hypothetical protein